MDHLPSPKGCNLGDLYRPKCIAGDYNGGPLDFLEWPKTSRWPVTYSAFFSNKITGTTGTFRDANSIRACEMLFQTWLYFGLLHTFFHDIGGGPEHFILVRDEDDDEGYVHTENLGSMLDELRKQKTDPEVVSYRTQCLQTVFDMLVRSHTTAPGMDKKILLSIIILAEVLERQNQQADGKDPRQRYPTAIKWAHLVKPLNLLDLSDDLHHRLADYFVAPRVYMHECQRLLKASSVPKVVSSQVYRHCCRTRDCELVKIDVLKVQSILEAGDTAVLGSSSAGLDVVPAKNGPYVAISHVWAHGLGNPADNVLPRCQVDAVMDAAQRLCEKGRLSQPIVWLDTLCCPTNSPRHRNLCHLRMEQIYRDAECVLIIDPTLCQLSRDDFSDLQLAALLALSDWNTRIWTFQEGMLAKQIHFQIQDDFINLDELRAAIIQRYFLEQMPVIAPIAQTLDYIRPVYTPGPRGAGIATFSECRNIMRYRQLSVPTDETLCLSVCLGLEQDGIIAAGARDRMPAFWKAYVAAGKTLPRSIIFFYGDRLESLGWRWSPSSIVFLGVWHITPYEEDRFASLEPQGLYVEYPGFVLKGKAGMPGKQYRSCRTVDGVWYTLCHNTDKSLSKYYQPFPAPDEESIVLIAEAGLSELDRSRDIDCLGGSISRTANGVHHFVPHGSCSIEKRSESEQRQRERTWQGILALIRSAGSEMEARKIVEAMPDDQEMLLNRAVASGVDMSVGFFRRLALMLLDHPVLELREVWPEHQKWCIG